MTRHRKGNMARYNWVDQLRRLQTAILRYRGDGIGSRQGVDASFRDDMRL